MSKITTIDAIERNCISRSGSFSYGITKPLDNHFEVLFTINGKPRRFALCKHEKDARVIVQAMNEYTERGGSWV